MFISKKKYLKTIEDLRENYENQIDLLIREKRSYDQIRILASKAFDLYSMDGVVKSEVSIPDNHTKLLYLEFKNGNFYNFEITLRSSGITIPIKEE